MRLVLTLLCRNEADIIRSTVDFHLAQGVDLIIATDNGSIDGTTEILQEYAMGPKLRLLHQPNHTHDQSVWVTHMARLAIDDHGADWLIHCDADEFWYPSHGTLKERFSAFSQTIQALQVQRSNFLPPPLNHPSLHMPFFANQLIREQNSLNALGNPLPGKICHRSIKDVEISDGNHSLSVNGQPVGALGTDEIQILHFPVRSLAQFERKIREGTQALEANTRISPGIGNTWRKLYYDYVRNGTLSEYYCGLIPDADRLQLGLADGHLIEDHRLLNALGGSH
jgi:hypothetical protein